ncbi:hypothetical protein RHMOL_Rhmol13G0176700 [Rhododendron molle]|uniref:Uncharacterized protein n=1 Tax=Rhododendron molle TaxID=49168 RepID=A0ACC0L7W0_RHOML|nr:hypothetical protein RHMOL_Rhmol13G0176700 [Rhododendron molle]
MPASATVIGALLGLGTQMYSNALRKLPYMRHPWEHVLGMGLGVVFVNQLVKWDAKLQEDLDKMLEKAKAANERRYFGMTDSSLKQGWVSSKSPVKGLNSDSRLGRVRKAANRVRKAGSSAPRFKKACALPCASHLRVTRTLRLGAPFALNNYGNN